MRSDTVIFFALLTTLSVTAVNGFYDDTDEVIQITFDTYEAELYHSHQIWVMEFYVPWCSFSKAFAPSYKEAAKGLQNIFKVGAIDCSKGSQEETICNFYNVDEYPTVLLLGPNKAIRSGLRRFSGNKSARHVTDEALISIQELISDRLAYFAESATFNVCSY